jgi:hypothetical protein
MGSPTTRNETNRSVKECKFGKFEEEIENIVLKAFEKAF